MCNTESKLFIEIKSDEFYQNHCIKILTDNSLGYYYFVENMI